MSRRVVPAGALLTLVTLYLVMAVGVGLRSLGTVVVAGLASYVVDAVLLRTAPERLLRGLDLVDAGLAWRFLIRQVLLAAALFRTVHLSAADLTVVVLCIVGHHLAVGLYDGFLLLIQRRRLRRVETRNLPMPEENLPPAAPAWLDGVDGRLPLLTDLVWWAAAAVAVVGTDRLIAPAAILMVGLALVPAVIRVPELWRLARLQSGERRLAAARQAVAQYRAEVLLHHSGGVTSAYQVNMWLETVARLDQRALVILRERRYFEDIAATTVPIVCLPFTSDVMSFTFPGARIALYVANVGKNIHLLRMPNLLSAFIGHGDSDKSASFNPFTKVYDEVWVAGAAGRDRYRKARVGVRDDQIVLVGRPQLDRIEQAAARSPQAPYTVLYAPTWEGWVDDPAASSLVPMGRQIVRTLLATPNVRVVFKPHPLTGTVNDAAGRIRDDIAAQLRAAGAPHQVVLGPEPQLYDCFAESDALISDISSVVSDYVASEKPYFVANVAGQPDEAFRAENPTASAAYLIGPGAAGLAEGLVAARGGDPLAGQRHELRVYLLGPAEEPAMVSFQRAVTGLVSRASGRLAALRTEADPGVGSAKGGGAAVDLDDAVAGELDAHRRGARHPAQAPDGADDDDFGGADELAR